MTTPMLVRKPSTSFGILVAAAKVMVCGKLWPCGSFHGP